MNNRCDMDTVFRWEIEYPEAFGYIFGKRLLKFVRNKKDANHNDACIFLKDYCSSNTEKSKILFRHYVKNLSMVKIWDEFAADYPGENGLNSLYRREREEIKELGKQYLLRNIDFLHMLGKIVDNELSKSDIKSVIAYISQKIGLKPDK